MASNGICSPPCPCVGCERPCNYTGCAPYRDWLNKCWATFRQMFEEVTRQAEAKKQGDKRDVWRYDSPTLVRDYLAQGPCPKCGKRDQCKDRQSCPAYDRWTADRWKMIRHRLLN